MAAASTLATQPHPLPAAPPLYTGDPLARDEFHRRDSAHPDLTAELLEGAVYVASRPMSASGSTTGPLVVFG